MRISQVPARLPNNTVLSQSKKYGHILNNLKYTSLSNIFSVSLTASQEFIHKAEVLPKQEARAGLIRND